MKPYGPTIQLENSKLCFAKIPIISEYADTDDEAILHVMLHLNIVNELSICFVCSLRVVVDERI